MAVGVAVGVVAVLVFDCGESPTAVLDAMALGTDVWRFFFLSSSDTGYSKVLPISGCLKIELSKYYKNCSCFYI